MHAPAAGNTWDIRGRSEESGSSPPATLRVSSVSVSGCRGEPAFRRCPSFSSRSYHKKRNHYETTRRSCVRSPAWGRFGLRAVTFREVLHRRNAPRGSLSHRDEGRGALHDGTGHTGGAVAGPSRQPGRHAESRRIPPGRDRPGDERPAVFQGILIPLQRMADHR